MADQDNLLLILDKISDVKESVGVLKNEVQHVKEDLGGLKTELKAIADHDEHQNRLLDEHISGVRTAMERLELERSARLEDKQIFQKQIRELDARLKKTEFLPNFATSLKKIIVWTAGFVAACGAIAKWVWPVIKNAGWF